jgi:hypothetical protein
MQSVLPLLMAGLGLNWAQPPVGCIEDFVPKTIDRPCLDLSQLPNPNVSLPPELIPEEVQFWNVDHRANLSLCRAIETDRRHRLGLQNFSADVLLVTWMRLNSAQDLDQKVSAIYEAANNVGMPPQILFGALKQESLLSNLGLTPDGNNYSCGLGQINIQEWCRYVSGLNSVEQIQMGWPTGITCDPQSLPTTLLAPFYQIAALASSPQPDYLWTKENFKSIQLHDVVADFPTGTGAEQKSRFEAVISFLNHCQDPRSAIFAKAAELKHLFNEFVPRSLQRAQHYSKGDAFKKNCQNSSSRTYPLHTGWLLAVAIYNAGPKQVPLVQHYFSRKHLSKKLSPLDLIEALHWGGIFNSKDGLIHFDSPDGTQLTQSWFKSCIVQRHIARVIQYSTLPGFEIAQSLETEGCSKTKIPEYRKTSSGKK